MFIIPVPLGVIFVFWNIMSLTMHKMLWGNFQDSAKHLSNGWWITSPTCFYVVLLLAVAHQGETTNTLKPIPGWIFEIGSMVESIWANIVGIYLLQKHAIDGKGGLDNFISDTAYVFLSPNISDIILTRYMLHRQGTSTSWVFLVQSWRLLGLDTQARCSYSW